MLLRIRFLCACLALASLASAAPVTVTVLATTDLHGNIYPIDYFTAQPAERGLAKMAGLIRGVRAENPNTLLIDCGDTIEGSPLESLWQRYVAAGRLPLGLSFAGAPLVHDPMMLVMNRLGYRSMTVGNHEFNFGLKNFERARRDAQFPWISANIVSTGGPAFRPYIVETVGGVKVAIIGVTTTGVPNWEEPSHYAGYRFIDPGEAVASAVEQLRAKEHPNLIVVAAHTGLGHDPRRSDRPPTRQENSVYDIVMKVPGIDAVVFGHTHLELAGETVNGVLVVQPKNWGISLARLDFTFDSGKLRDKRSRLLPASSAPPDPEVLTLAKPYQDLTERYLNTPVAESPVEMDGRVARVEDTPLMDAIQRVQMYYTKADVSFASLFNPRVHIPKGPITVRQIAALYIYDNELYAIEGDGRMVKDALENAARYFAGCPDPACSHGPLLTSRMPGYNFDMVEGVEYEIDLTKPEGQRVVNLRRNGKPLRLDEKLRIAVNSYRAGGSNGYTMFRDAKVLWRSNQDIRSLIIAYYADHGKLPERADGNWRIVPPAAEKILERESVEEASKPVNR